MRKSRGLSKPPPLDFRGREFIVGQSWHERSVDKDRDEDRDEDKTDEDRDKDGRDEDTRIAISSPFIRLFIQIAS